MSSMPATVAYLKAAEIDELHGTHRGDPAKLALVEEDQAAAVPPRGNGDVHDCAATFIHSTFDHRPFPDGHRRVAHRGTTRIYGRNGWVIADLDELADLTEDADERRLSIEALCKRLKGLVYKAW